MAKKKLWRMADCKRRTKKEREYIIERIEI